MTKLRWGFLGAAGIARKNWKALFHSGNNILVAVAARDAARAGQFVQELQAQLPFEPAPKVRANYEALLASPDIDAVYVPLPTALRKDWVIKAAQAGKHVVCEKPCAVNAGDLREMIAACTRNKVQFMDGVMFMHSARLAAVRAVLDDPVRVGPIRRITSEFSFLGDERHFPDSIRVQAALEPAGCLGDLGWYCLRISLFAMQYELPASAIGRILAVAKDGRTPTEFVGELSFANGGSAGFHCSFVMESQQWAVISGKFGTVRIPDFVHPYNSYEPGFEINAVEHRVKAEVSAKIPAALSGLNDSGHATAQDTRMFRNFSTQVQSEKLNTEWPEIALKTQLVLDACLASARNSGEPVAVAPI